MTSIAASSCQVLWKAACLLLVFTAPTRGEIAIWSEPELDRWFHLGDTTPGLKTEMSTFTNYGVSSEFSQSRAGSFMLGFNTASQTDLLNPALYTLNSVRFTIDFVDDGRQVIYDPSVDSLSAISEGTDDPGNPIELFGIGYANDYERLGFDTNDSFPPEFEESSPLWPNVPTLERTFNVYPLGDDGTGNFGNVFNSPGGEGTFVLDGEDEPQLLDVLRDPWNTTPWAVGTVAGLNAGQAVPGGSVFSLEVDLQKPGVLEYFQQSLTTGQVGVFITSLHDVSGFHNGIMSDFPAFYSKESLFVSFGVASAPTLEIDYTVLTERTPGDFDGDHDIDADDLGDWQTHFGIDSGADANGDGDTDGADFLAWQRNFTGPNLPMLNAVPEPATAPIAICLAVLSNLTSRPSRWII
ncbi:hypothetical protein [Bythopirellula polymerisocia]|uniref:PEP-CTERM protein-sorting domain-containing protein n=1 Tax=Bythopirellula polymerisocia TaxID=2528003 RepID=A0A5C6CX74_9BACT|nr:hypothetical protein [Bythopirellula polymerisocia]TWU29573.1 hypothetical protein Pla144_03510 [Bythopirellula polymerisocia]